MLVVDDNATNRRILEEMLTSWRMRPTMVASGAEALRELEHARHSGAPYPLVILDAMMPEMDGFALAEKIRKPSRPDVTYIGDAVVGGSCGSCRAFPEMWRGLLRNQAG